MASIIEIVSYFNSAKQQAIVWHQQTLVYSEHKTLNEFYDEINDLLDSLSESYAGIYGRLTPYFGSPFVPPPHPYKYPVVSIAKNA